MFAFGRPAAISASGQPVVISLSTAVESSVVLADQVAFEAVVNLMFVQEPELEEPLQAALHLRKILMTSVRMFLLRILVRLYIALVWLSLLELALVPEAVLVFQLWVDMLWSC